VVGIGAYLFGSRGRDSHPAGNDTAVVPKATSEADNQATSNNTTRPSPSPAVPTPTPIVIVVTATPIPNRQPSALAGEHYPETRTQYLSSGDIDNWSYANVRYALNEIYARHGFEFESAPIRNQFLKFDWYHPVYGRTQSETERLMSSREHANMQLLAARKDELVRMGVPTQ
jgi:hypothetical protein